MPEATPPDLYQMVGRSIAAARRAREWSQSDLARATGLSRGSIANIERGAQQAPLGTIWVIGTALEVEPRSLIPLTRDALGTDRVLGVTELPRSARQLVEGAGPSTRRALDSLLIRARRKDAT